MALIVHYTPAEAYADYMRDMRGFHRTMQERIVEYQSATNSREILRHQAQMIAKRNFFNSVKEIPGIIPYAKAQRDDDKYEIVTEHTTVMANLEACIDFVAKNFPTATYLSFDANDNPVYMSFTPEQLAGLRQLMQTFVDSVSVES